MASNTTTTIVPVQCVKTTRFSTEQQHGWRVEDMQQRPDGMIAMSGFERRTNRTFIDIFVIGQDNGGQCNIIYSKEFNKHGGGLSHNRRVSFMSDSVIVTCVSNKMESYDIIKDVEIKSIKMDGSAAAMTVSREGEVYVSVWRSNKVIVYNNNLDQIKTITLLSGIRDDGLDCAGDITVMRDTLFVRTLYGKALLYNMAGRELAELTAKNQTMAWSIAVSSELIYVLCSPGTLITVHNHPSLVEGHDGGHVEGHDGGHVEGHDGGGHDVISKFQIKDSTIILINNNILMGVHWETGEVCEYSMDDIFLSELNSVINKTSFRKLLKSFRIPADNAKTITDVPALVHHVTEAGFPEHLCYLQLIKACTDIGLKKAVEILVLYQRQTYRILADRVKSIEQITKCSNRKRRPETAQHQASEYHTYILAKDSSEKANLELISKLESAHLAKQESEQQLESLRLQLSTMRANLQTAEQEGADLKESSTKLQRKVASLSTQLEESTIEFKDAETKWRTKLDEAKRDLQRTKLDLQQSQLKSAKEAMALKEVLEQTSNTLQKKEKGTVEVSAANISVGESLDKRPSIPESTLAADFGRLLVEVSEDLTLDSTLKLAWLFNLPPAQTDLLRRISIIETPGGKLLDILKKRDIINRFDVINLQKGLQHVHLNRTNETLLVPYQKKVDPQLHLENKTEDVLSWPEIEAPIETTAEVQARDTSFAERADLGGTLAEKISYSPVVESGPEDETVRAAVPGREHHHPYIEQMIRHRGGTINVVSVSLSIPAGAVTDDQVIGVEVIQGSDMHLPGSNDRSRITPLVKLEPLGYKFEAPVHITIPHSAVIPEPDRHTLKIYTGQQSRSTDEHKDEITWKEDNNVTSKLNNSSVNITMYCLSHLVVNLVSQVTEQKHIIRAVPFVDGIFKLEDDILISIYFCKDSDEDYKLLLEDHRDKLSLGEYLTFQVTRSSISPALGLKLSVEDDAYRLLTDESSQIDIDHLCTASRVCRQFKLRKNKGIFVDTKMLEVTLTVGQGDHIIPSNLKTKVTSLFLTPESQAYLSKVIEPGPYRELKNDIATQLEVSHCKKLSSYFELTPAENERVVKNKEPGTMLLKILDEREFIMPTRLVDLYEGLKFIHLDKVARLILLYTEFCPVEENSRSTAKSDSQIIKSTADVAAIPAPSQQEPRLGTLLDEGFSKTDAALAWQLASKRLSMARQFLQIKYKHKEIHGMDHRWHLPKEKYLTTDGGEILLPETGVHVVIPAGALSENRIVSVSITDSLNIEGPLVGSTPRLSPLVNCEPATLQLLKHCVVRIPHCVSVSDEKTEVDVFFGQYQDDKMTWTYAQQDTRCTMKTSHFEVVTRALGLIGVHVGKVLNIRKRIRVIPLISRTATNEMTISIWFYNDEDTEHKILLNEEIGRSDKIQLHPFKSFSLERMQKPLYIDIRCTNIHCRIPEEEKRIEIDQEALWLRGRYKVDVHLHITDRTEAIGLEITSLYWWTRSNHFQFHISKKVKELHQQHEYSTQPSVEDRLPQGMMIAFRGLRLQLTKCIDVDTAVDVSRIMGLTNDEVSSIKQSSDPALLLWDILLDKSIISIMRLSPLESALVAYGKSKAANLLQEFRRDYTYTPSCYD